MLFSVRLSLPEVDRSSLSAQDTDNEEAPRGSEDTAKGATSAKKGKSKAGKCVPILRTPKSAPKSRRGCEREHEALSLGVMGRLGSPGVKTDWSLYADTEEWTGRRRIASPSASFARCVELFSLSTTSLSLDKVRSLLTSPFTQRKQAYIKELEAKAAMMELSRDEQFQRFGDAFRTLLEENQKLRTMLQTLSGFIGEGLGGALAKIGTDLPGQSLQYLRTHAFLIHFVCRIPRLYHTRSN